MSKKKILIIYEKMGMGHQRMANILKDILGGDEDVEIITHAGSELQGTNDIYTIVKLWNFFIRKNLIRTVDILVNFALRIFVLPFIEVHQTAPFMNKLEEIKPDIIISTADGFNKVIGAYASEKNIPFYIVITEISTFSDLIVPYATHICYFNETPEAIRNYDFNLAYFSYRLDRSTKFRQKVKYVLRSYNELVLHAFRNSIYRNPNKSLEQINDAKCEVIGPLAEKKHFSPKNIVEIKERFNIPRDRDTVLVVSGSIGGKFLMEMVKSICKSYNRPINLLVMCGNDKLIYEKVSAYKNNNTNINIMPYGYINNFDEFLAASDCLIARPSAGIFIESLLNRTPMVTFDVVTSNDKGTLTMIDKYDIGKICSEDEELLPSLNEILEKKDKFKGNIDKLLKNYYSSYEDKKIALRSLILEDGAKSMLQTDLVGYNDKDQDYDVEPTYSNNILR